MSRVALCLLFIAIFQHGIQKSSQENGTLTDDLTKISEKTLTSKEERAKTSEAPEIADKPKEETETKANEAKAEDGTEQTGSASSSRAESTTKKPSISPIDPMKPTLEFPNTILGPVSQVGATMEDVVSKGVDGAKNFAGGAFKLLKNTVTKLF